MYSNGTKDYMIPIAKAILSWLSHGYTSSLIWCKNFHNPEYKSKKDIKLFVGHLSNQVINMWNRSTETGKHAKQHEDEWMLALKIQPKDGIFNWQTKTPDRWKRKSPSSYRLLVTILKSRWNMNQERAQVTTGYSTATSSEWFSSSYV